MKNTIITAIFVASSVNVFAQEEEEVKEKNLYNHWSIEANVGQNKAVRPYSAGYFSSDPTNYFNFSDVNHFDLGARYMFSNIFGLKLDFAYDAFADQSGSGSLPFDSKQYRIGIQGVANLARIMKFESFTKRFGLLAHAGIQVSQLTPQMGVNKNATEDNGGIIIGLTPQVRITDKIVVTGDFTAINNVRQHFNWDGSYSAQDNNLSGLMYNISLGLTVYLGKKDKHADWYLSNDQQAKNDELKETRQKLAEIEYKLNDTDRDGIVDYLDTQNNTPAGVVVDSKGRFIDTNRNGVPDELERKANDGKEGNNQVDQSDALKSLVEKGYVNVFFDVNQDNPNAGSTNNVYHIINFLRSYPDAKAKLVGYADVRGNESKNKDLSLRRSQRLYAIIIASGINATRVTIEGQGVDASYPADSKIGLDLARRVSIILK
jgi:OOP family OmpA-OmpF porin